MSEQLYEHVRRESDKVGKSMSEWVRGFLVGGVVVDIIKSKNCFVCGKETDRWAYDSSNRVVCRACSGVS